MLSSQGLESWVESARAVNAVGLPLTGSSPSDAVCEQLLPESQPLPQILPFKTGSSMRQLLLF